jgi:uncharacterized membrane protein (Fun14 family)
LGFAQEYYLINQSTTGYLKVYNGDSYQSIFSFAKAFAVFLFVFKKMAINVDQDEMMRIIEECEKSRESYFDKIIDKLGLDNLFPVSFYLIFF